MGRKRKAKNYSIVFSDTVACVGEDRVYVPESEPENSLMEQLQCPIADEVLIAMRKAFSLTFPCNPFIDGVQAALTEIRRIGVEALKPMPEVLADLGLPPIPPIMDDPALRKTQIFLFVFARTDDIDITVKVDGKRRRLLDYFGNEDATPLLTTLRAVVSDTFEEAHDEDQHSALLQRIRKRIHAVLPAYNACLESIDVEPIAACSAKSKDDGDSGREVVNPKPEA